MIQVTLGTNTNRKKITCSPTKTLREVLEENGIDYHVGGIHLDGISVAGEELNRSFEDHGVTEDCILISVVKGDGGVM